MSANHAVDLLSFGVSYGILDETCLLVEKKTVYFFQEVGYPIICSQIPINPSYEVADQ